MQAKIDKLKKLINEKYHPDPDIFEAFLFHLKDAENDPRRKDPVFMEKIEKPFDKFCKNLSDS